MNFEDTVYHGSIVLFIIIHNIDDKTKELRRFLKGTYVRHTSAIIH